MNYRPPPADWLPWARRAFADLCGISTAVATPLASRGRGPEWDFVYLMRAMGGDFKIGHSLDPMRRRAAIAGRPRSSIAVVSQYPTDPVLAYPLEQRTHRYFGKFRIRGEWFRLPQRIHHIFADVVCQLEGTLAIARMAELQAFLDKFAPSTWRTLLPPGVSWRLRAGTPRPFIT